jgi:hypothetical protein
MSDAPAGRFRTPLVAFALVVVAGLLWGLAWFWIAPTAKTQVIDGGVYLNGHDNLFASQDGWFAVLGAVVGALLSVVWPYLTRRTPVAGVVAGLVGSTVSGLLAWWLGSTLGPDPLKTQLQHGIKAPITPVMLHTSTAVLMAPLFFAAVRIVIETVRHFLDGRAEARPQPVGSAAQGVHVEQG